jgi:hypothetical protein
MEKESKPLEEETEAGEPEIEPEEKENLGEEDEAKETSLGGGEPEIDYEKKFSESTRENQILLAKLKAAEEKLGKVAITEIPAEQELKNLYPDWEMMGELERKLAEKSLIFERRLKKVEQDFSGMKEEREWNEQLDNFLEKVKILENYPELEEKEKEFREFAKKPTHKGVSLEVLAKAFLFKKEEAIPPTRRAPVLEPGSGGPKEASPKKKMTPEELRVLRQTNYKKYKEIITKHPNWIPTEIK